MLYLNIFRIEENKMSKTVSDKNSKSIKLREQLMKRAQKLIVERKLTQAQAADEMGVSQPRISDLVNNKSDRFSLDMLVTMLFRVGVKVDIVVEK